MMTLGTTPVFNVDLDNLGADGDLELYVVDSTGSPVRDDPLNSRRLAWRTTNGTVVTVSRIIPTSGTDALRAAVKIKNGGEGTITLTTDSNSTQNARQINVKFKVTDRRSVPITRIGFTPAAMTLQVGATQRVTVTAYDANNAAHVPDQQVTFSGTSNLRVTTVDKYHADVTALAGGGTGTVTATAYTQTATLAVTIPGPPATITLAAPSPLAIVASCKTIATTRRDAGGLVTTLGGSVQWTIDQPTIATLTPNGDQASVCPGSASGTFTVTATVSGATGPVQGSLQLQHFRVTRIALSPASLSLHGYDSATVVATVYGEAGAGEVVLDPVIDGVNWAGNNPAAVRLSNFAARSVLVSGGDQTGTATITAALGGVTATLPVSQIALLHVSLTGPNDGGPQYITTAGTYTWQASAYAGGVTPFTYYWEYSVDNGATFRQLMDSHGYPFPSSATTVQRDVDCASPQYIYVRVRATSSDGQSATASLIASNPMHGSDPTGASPCNGTAYWY